MAVTVFAHAVVGVCVSLIMPQSYQRGPGRSTRPVLSRPRLRNQQLRAHSDHIRSGVSETRGRRILSATWTTHGYGVIQRMSGMGHPEITPEQREMAVVMLANALRRDAHLRTRLQAVGADGNPLRAGLTKRRAEPSQRYVDGMRYLLGVLFADGPALAEACLAEAYARALGTSAHVPQREQGRPGEPGGNGKRDL